MCPQNAMTVKLPLNRCKKYTMRYFMPTQFYEK